MMRRALTVLLFLLAAATLQGQEDSRIDWINGKIYSSITVTVKNDYNFAHNRMKEIEKAREKAKINYYRILKNLTLSDSLSLLDYLQNAGDKNRYLFSLIDQAYLHKVEYPSLNHIKLTYYINLYGKEKSLMNIIMDNVNIYTEEPKSYMGYNYSSDYTGIIIDARGILTTYEGYKVKSKPTIFVTIKDTEGRVVIDKNNVYPEVIIEKGMVRYTYDVNENLESRVGKKPLRLVAYGAGDQRGSILVVSEINAKRMLASQSIREAIQHGKIAIIIDEK